MPAASHHPLLEPLDLVFNLSPELTVDPGRLDVREE
jgi:hypothetical protein